MKWTQLIVLSLLISLLPALPLSGAEECLRLMSLSAPLDTDNDGTPDEYDVLVGGNAVVVVSVDSLELNGTWDPNINMALDGSGNGILELTEWRSVLLQNVSTLNNSGYGEGGLWYGIDIYENNFKCYVDGTLMLDDHDFDNNFPVGSVAVILWEKDGATDIKAAIGPMSVYRLLDRNQRDSSATGM